MDVASTVAAASLAAAVTITMTAAVSVAAAVARATAAATEAATASAATDLWAVSIGIIQSHYHNVILTLGIKCHPAQLPDCHASCVPRFHVYRATDQQWQLA